MGDVQQRDRAVVRHSDGRERWRVLEHRHQCERRQGDDSAYAVRDHCCERTEQSADDQRHAVDQRERGKRFAFRPTAADADGNTLTFAISNRPAWATFNAATGQLAGTPTATSAGTYSNIVISVSDGTASAALAPFSIAVVDASNGAATLTWTPPTTNTDGSTLTTLAGYRIAYGTSAAQLTQTIQISNAGMSSYVVENLAPGTYYFALRAYTRRRLRERELERRNENRAMRVATSPPLCELQKPTRVSVSADNCANAWAVVYSMSGTQGQNRRKTVTQSLRSESADALDSGVAGEYDAEERRDQPSFRFQPFLAAASLPCVSVTCADNPRTELA